MAKKSYYFISYRQEGHTKRGMIEDPGNLFIDEEPWEFVARYLEEGYQTVVLWAMPVSKQVYDKFDDLII